MIKRSITQLLMSLAGILFLSCTSADYVHVIPEGATALVSVDVSAVGTETNQGAKANLFLSLLKVTDPMDCGLDFGKRVYLFETADGTLGMTAKVSSRSKAAQWLEKMEKTGKIRLLADRKGHTFAVLNGSWLVGLSDAALLVMGPVISSGQASTVSQMAKYLSQDEDHCIVGTPIFDKLDSISSGVAMVAQAQAFPEKLISLLTLGAPKDADASQVMIAAEMSVADNCLLIRGETFSFNKRINDELQKSAAVFRPIKGRYGAIAYNGHLFTLFVNTDGTQFLPLLRQNPFLQSMLLGINTAIDMDNIIKSIDGDVALTADNIDESKLSLAMGAEMSSLAFTEDVDYWKQSCPKGSSIDNWQKDSWHFTNGNQHFFFGVRQGQPSVFFGGTDADMATKMQNVSSDQQMDSLHVKGEKMVAVISIAQTDNELVKTFTSLLKPLFGQLTSIVYYRK